MPVRLYVPSVHSTVKYCRRMRDVKYLHKSCNTKKSPFIKWGMQQVVFFHNQQYIMWMGKTRRKKSDYIKVFLFIFFIFIIFLVSRRFFFYSMWKSLSVVLFTEWKIVIMSSTFRLFTSLTFVASDEICCVFAMTWV